MSRKLKTASENTPAGFTESRVKKILFITVLALIGLVLAVFGFCYRETNPADSDNDFLIMGWLFAIPGIVCFLDSFFYLLNRTYRTNASFVFANFCLVLLGIFVSDTVFFIIMKALDTHETVFKLGHSILAVLGISALYALLTLLPACLYRILTRKKKAD